MVDIAPVASDTTAEIAAEILRANTGEDCMPSQESIQGLKSSDIVLVSGQFVGGGKSSFIENLERSGRVNIPSWTNRELRATEVEGVDKVRRPLDDMAQRAVEGFFLELEEVRAGDFYATPATFTPGESHVKDLELKGALRLRSFVPGLNIVVPLPPVRGAASFQVSEWERRVIKREGLQRAITAKDVDNIEKRLLGVIEEATRIEDLDLYDDPDTYLLINDDKQTALDSMYRFLATGEKANQSGIRNHVLELRNIAETALGVVVS